MIQHFLPATLLTRVQHKNRTHLDPFESSPAIYDHAEVGYAAHKRFRD